MGNFAQNLNLGKRVLRGCVLGWQKSKYFYWSSKNDGDAITLKDLGSVVYFCGSC